MITPTHGGVVNTIVALLFAMLLISIVWGLTTYITEMGSQEGMKEGKNIFMGGVTLLFLLMIVFGIIEWIRASIGL